jgi:hypothetical protein
MIIRLLGVGLISAVTVVVSSQVAPKVEGSPQDATQKAENSSQESPKNLTALPKEITREEINKLMASFTRELGVPCGYCHEQDPDSKVINYSSDGNPVKATARIMIGMTSDINKKYLAQLGDRRYAEPLTCGNCHQGHANPPSF